MFQYGQVSKGGAKVYDDKLPELLSADASYQLWLELKSLMAQLPGAGLVDGAMRFRAQREVLINSLIEGNMRIGAAIAAQYARSLPWAKYDLFSEAMLSLTAAMQTVDQHDFKEPRDLRGYLRKSIHGTVGKYLSNCIYGFDVDTKQISRIKKGKDSQFKNIRELTRIQTLTDDDDKNRTIINRMTMEQGREHLIDRMERLMKDSGLEDIEYKVMVFYLAGYTEEATAKELGVCKLTVHYRKHEAIEKMRYIFFDPSVDLESGC